MGILHGWWSKLAMLAGVRAAKRELKASADSNFEKAIKLTLEKSAPCRQRRYGMKNYDMS